MSTRHALVELRVRHVVAAWLLAGAACTAVTEAEELAAPHEVEHDATVPGDGLARGPRARPATQQRDDAAKGRFAGLFSLTSESSCSQSWGIYRSTASFVLDLAADGVATACRGRRSIDVGGGWDDDPRELRFDVQQGFAGTWSRVGKGWIEIELAVDDDPCPTIGTRDAQPWTLRCKTDETTFSVAVLACRFGEPVPADTLGFLADYAPEGQWMLLGAGDGIVVDWQNNDAASELAVARPDAPLTAESWAGLNPPEPIVPTKGGPRVLAR